MTQRGPIRTCVACRERHPARDLLRLRVDADGMLDLADATTASGARSAWVCPTASCLSRVEAKPGTTRRSLRAQVRRVAPLLDHAREDAEARLAAALLAASRAGLVRHGRSQRARIPEERVAATLIAEGGSTPTGAWQLPWPAPLVGRLLGRGPRATLVLLAGSPADGVLRELRHLRALG